MEMRISVVVLVNDVESVYNSTSVTSRRGFSPANNACIYRHACLQTRRLLPSTRSHDFTCVSSSQPPTCVRGRVSINCDWQWVCSLACCSRASINRRSLTTILLWFISRSTLFLSAGFSRVFSCLVSVFLPICLNSTMASDEETLSGNEMEDRGEKTFFSNAEK